MRNEIMSHTQQQQQPNPKRRRRRTQERRRRRRFFSAASASARVIQSLSHFRFVPSKSKVVDDPLFTRFPPKKNWRRASLPFPITSRPPKIENLFVIRRLSRSLRVASWLAGWNQGPSTDGIHSSVEKIKKINEAPPLTCHRNTRESCQKQN